jgi:hypothetical protein
MHDSTATSDPWYTAATAGGAYLEGGRDLDALLTVLRHEIMGPDCQDDVVVSSGPDVVALLLRDGRTVLVRPDHVAVVHERYALTTPAPVTGTDGA